LSGGRAHRDLVTHVQSQERSGGWRTGTAGTKVEDGVAVEPCHRLLQDNRAGRGRERGFLLLHSLPTFLWPDIGVRRLAKGRLRDGGDLNVEFACLGLIES